MTADAYSEDTLIEQPTIALFGQLGWPALNCFEESPATFGRETTAEVVLRPRLLAACDRSIPLFPPNLSPSPSKNSSATTP